MKLSNLLLPLSRRLQCLITKQVIIGITLIFTISNVALAENSTRQEIRYLVKKYRLTNASIGIAVQRVNSKEMLYQYAQNRFFIPASNNKIFTAIAALATLPANFQFQTRVFYQKSKFNNGTLKGNLYIDFSGDPSLTGSSLYNLIAQIKQNGIKKIDGDIIAVANKFTGSYIPEGWSHEDTKYCYAAPASTMNMNKNCTVIKLINTSGNKTKVEEVANTSDITFKNSATIEPYNIRKNCPFTLNMDDDNVTHLSGCLPRKAEFYMSLAIANPALKTLDTIKDFVKEIGLVYTGDIIIGNLPKQKLDQLAEIRSAPLSDLLTHMLLKSDNLYAESFARTVGYVMYGAGSTTMATKAIENILTKTYHADTKALVMKDGSGLSILDRVTPLFMVNLLSNVYNSNIGKRLYSYLPTSGVDGTLAYRMGGHLQGKVHAKTGTLDGVSTLSGYLLSQKNHLLSFSIMLNDLHENQRNKARIFQDKVVDVFYRTL
ncbi:D-alanyl-D-alanine carboxypeptidase/D-alanyl-D-alanine endopeptidase [Facilibium subflavum]|uniref:D-alanyl-D-alanine carboxypeptidase/D-alanyl-D-alanine endopeptidase n=1 Tax=Facilibium subflavum TaxID=2219058 RepID=UPI000E65A5B6|nr:D-alanyl-D-alanine carboxypeptidase/D-alanyl-D-alanine-endopeptidase [Facilibium subflavum]